ncbi:hypothetical protein [Nitratireductor sp. XY-223]|uniref:hypothetical protein n=1 Tax=Nitratireductor sp. XY-223 TaxID=2561926 RepID=UPI0010A99712|nr:hypothetical protein [Nitratireductor sp. XY-223]
MGDVSSHDCKGTRRKTSVGFTLETRGPQRFTEPGCRNIGAYQEDGALFELNDAFGWIEHKPEPGDGSV